MMVKGQTVNQQIWDVISWSQKLMHDMQQIESGLSKLKTVKDLKHLDKEYFPTTSKHFDDIMVNKKFQGMPLLDGWLIEKSENNVHDWIRYDFHEYAVDLHLMSTNLKKKIEER